MAVQKLSGNTLVRIIVPSLARDMKKIPTQIRNDIIQGIDRSFTNLNGGSRSFDASGSWQSEKNGHVSEKITIIESHGSNPFTNDDIEAISEQLNQEVIMVEEIEGIRAQLIGKDPEDKISPTTIEYGDGSKLVYSRHPDPSNPDSKGVFFVEHYDRSGNITERYSREITEDDEEEYLIAAHQPYDDIQDEEEMFIDAIEGYV